MFLFDYLWLVTYVMDSHLHRLSTPNKWKSAPLVVTNVSSGVINYAQPRWDSPCRLFLRDVMLAKGTGGAEPTRYKHLGARHDGTLLYIFCHWLPQAIPRDTVSYLSSIDCFRYYRMCQPCPTSPRLTEHTFDNSIDEHRIKNRVV